jgi:Transcriptional regulators
MKANRRFEDVLISIKNEIELRNLQPGDKLMPEREMSEALQVSRTSVREALRILEIFDVIQSKPGEGTTIKKPELANMLSNVYPFFMLPTATTVELLEARKVIEGGIAMLAAVRRQPEHIRRMEAAVELMASDDLDDQMRGELEFHTTMSEASGNKTLSDVLFVLSDMFSTNLQANRIPMYAMPGVSEEMYVQHKDVLKFIIEQDGERAKGTLENNLQYAIELLGKIPSSQKSTN